MAEHDRLPLAPVLVEDLYAVLGGDAWHGAPPAHPNLDIDIGRTSRPSASTVPNAEASPQRWALSLRQQQLQRGAIELLHDAAVGGDDRSGQIALRLLQGRDLLLDAVTAQE